MEEKEEDIVNSLKSISPKTCTIIIVLCLFALFYVLGYTIGFGDAYDGQKEYYEEKMEHYCICQEERIFGFENIVDVLKVDIK